MNNQTIEHIFNIAVRKANKLKYEYMTTEMILHLVLKDEFVLMILNSLKIDVVHLEEELVQYINTPQNFSILSDERIGSLNKEQFANEQIRELARRDGILYQPEMTISLQRVLQRVVFHAQSSGKKEIKPINLLISMMDEEDSFSVNLLKKYGVKKIDLIERIAHSFDRPLNSMSNNSNAQTNSQNVNGSININSDGANQTISILKELTIDLNQEAKENRIDPLIGREEEIVRIQEILARRYKNNVLLIGESGVGKSAILKGLALLAVEGHKKKILQNLKGYRFLLLETSTLIAGAKYRGELEGRLITLGKELSELVKTKEQIVLCIEDIHTFVNNNMSGGNGSDLAGLIGPLIIDKGIKTIGTTSYENFRRYMEKDSSFVRRFLKVDIKPPKNELVLEILRGIKNKYEEFHNVIYSDFILEKIITLSDRYLFDRFFPDKAIDLMDEIGSMVRLNSKNSKAESKAVTIKEMDVENIISKLANVPIGNIHNDESKKLQSLESNLNSVIFGQNEAIHAITTSIIMSRSGLTRKDKPIANFLFAGPTGVGKTELAKQSAFFMGISFLRFDMSEFMEKHSVSKLIGSPPGYIGFERGGVLTDAVKKSPYSLLLLDEIEKAHPEVYNILLQIMDHGKLTDAQGRTTDFSNCILIMTTNTGASLAEKGVIGIASYEKNISAKVDGAIRQFFTPEFRNRLDAIMLFNRLSEKSAEQIVEKFLKQLIESLLVKNIKLKVSNEAKKWILKKGVDPKMGARPLERFIDQHLKRPISEEIVFGKLMHGGSIDIFIDEKLDQLQISYNQN